MRWRSKSWVSSAPVPHYSWGPGGLGGRRHESALPALSRRWQWYSGRTYSLRSMFCLIVNICTLYHKYTVLSSIDATYWAAIRGCSARRGRMPSSGEIMELVGFRSRHAVSRLVDRLVAEGLVTKDPQGKLIPRALNGEVPMLGIVEAGFPSPAEEELVHTMTLHHDHLD